MVGEQMGSAALARLADQSHRSRRDATHAMCFSEQAGQLGPAPFEVSPEKHQDPPIASRARSDRFETGFCGSINGLAPRLEAFELCDGDPCVQLHGVLGSELHPCRPTCRDDGLATGIRMPSRAAAGEHHGDKHQDGHRPAHVHDTPLTRSARRRCLLGFHPPSIIERRRNGSEGHATGYQPRMSIIAASAPQLVWVIAVLALAVLPRWYFRVWRKR